jgi:hypothetical protein
MASAGVVTGSVTITATFAEFITAGVLNPQTLNETLTALGLAAGTLNFNNGTAAGLIDTLYAQPLALAASTPQTVDFTSVTDPGGASVTFARSRLFFVFNPNATAGHDVKVSQGASNGWAPLGVAANPQWARANGGFILMVDPLSTGAGNGNVITSTSKTVLFDPGALTTTVYVLMAGGSAA